MFQEYNINPYPGLRSFTEEESVYFKGRDSHVLRIIELLEEKKFLMVTGASGDGKSSLIYAGIIPNARAGFFKATYNNWAVASFRPERSPVRNFAKSLAPELEIENFATVETELNRGYSALIDLYKNSNLYIDTETAAWKNAGPEEQQLQSRTAKNLLVIVDQFEEFFTNPENYANEVPSQESVVLMNLLLETARLALKEGLPIYVVCTMRSDFIGQCAAFRGLPEYIGFSQFFVPRLKRGDLQQVIEEPAVLSGNQISKRLVERLIYDLAEGVDQLPILQHALNQVWIQADDKNEEMDLIHYAKVGGMPVEELPPEDLPRFQAWFKELPELEQKLFVQTGLQQVLDIHANKLYQDAWKYVNRHHSEAGLTVRDAKHIVAMTFACLTKIDQSRAVRNRMTLIEITKVINRPELTEEIVGAVINYFREPGNTFIRPFIGQDEQENVLNGEEALDITHESLIRNWVRLNNWAQNEFEYYQTFLDFQKQLNRWLESGKSRVHYLPIGPLTFFENWYNDCKPNQYWINRYNESELPPEEKLIQSGKTLENTREFLRSSARRLLVTRTFMKYGARRIGAFFAVLAIVGLSGFYYLDAESKLNQRISNKVEKLGQNLLSDAEADDLSKGQFIISAERSRPGAAMEIIDQLPSRRDQVTAASYAYLELMVNDNRFKGEFKFDLIKRLALALGDGMDTTMDPIYRLQHLNSFLHVLNYDAYFNPQLKLFEYQDGQSSRLREVFMHCLNNPGILAELDVNDFGRALDHLLNNRALDQADKLKILETVSAFSSSGSAVFEKLFPSTEIVDNGDFGSLSHNGGYQNIGALYASLGDMANVRRSVDSLVKYNPGYLDINNYNNGYNFVGYLLEYGYRDEVGDFMDFLSQKAGLEPQMAYNHLIDRTGHMKYFYADGFIGRRYDPILILIPWEEQEYIFDLSIEAIEKTLDSQEQAFQRALTLKRKALYYAKYYEDKGIMEYGKSKPNAWLDQALVNYRGLSPEFLNKEVSIDYRYYTIGFRQADVTKSSMFLYPDHYNNGWTSDNYLTDFFAKYLIDKELIADLYTDPESLELLNYWLRRSQQVFIFEPDLMRAALDLDRGLLTQMYDQSIQIPASGNVDFNLMLMMISNHHFAQGDSLKALDYFDKIQLDRLGISAAQGDYLDITFFYNELTQCAVNLALAGELESLDRVLEGYSNPNYKLIALGKITQGLHLAGKLNSLDYLDRLFELRSQVKDILIVRPDYRITLLHTLGLIGGQKLLDLGADILVDVSPSVPLYQDKKEDAFIQYITSMCQDGYYYQAYELISEDFSVTQELNCYNTILYQEAQNKTDDQWDRYDYNQTQFLDRYIVFQDQN